MSDALHVLKKLTKAEVTCNTSTTVLDIKHKIRFLSKQNYNIILAYVPAHKGFKYNEQVDKLSKTSHQKQQQELQVYVEKSTILTELTKKIYQEWHEYLQKWQDTNAYKNYVNNTTCMKKTINDLDITRCWNTKDTISYLKLIIGSYIPVQN